MYDIFRTTLRTPHGVESHTLQARTPARAAELAAERFDGTVIDIERVAAGLAIETRYWATKTGFGVIQYQGTRDLVAGGDWEIHYHVGGGMRTKLKPDTLGYRAAIAAMPEELRQ